MKKMKFGLLVAGLLVFGVSRCAVSQVSATGSVEGVVLLQNGTPASAFTVRLLGSSLSSTRRQDTQTDANGRYKFRGLQLGEYVLYLFNLTDQYPIRADMFMDSKPPRFQLSAQKAEVTVDVILPQPVGKILGKVVDMDGNPVAGATVVLCHADEVTRSAEIVNAVDGTFWYPVPSEEKLSILATKDRAAIQETGISVRPDEARTIVFKLTPKKRELHGNPCIPFRPSGK